MIKSLFKPDWWYLYMGKIKRTDQRKTTHYAKLKTRNCFYARSIFGAKDGYIRLSYGKVNIDQIEEGISRLREAILVCGK